MAEKTKSTPKDDPAAVLDVIRGFAEPYRAIGERIHELVLEAAPDLRPRLWYGMPGYARTKSTPVLVFFRLDGEVMSLGTTEKANHTLDEDAPDLLAPSAWFVSELDEPTERRISSIVRKAAS